MEAAVLIRQEVIKRCFQIENKHLYLQRKNGGGGIRIPVDIPNTLLQKANKDTTKIIQSTAITNTLTANYTKREGGNLDSTDPTYIGGGSEIEIDFTLDGLNLDNADDSHTPGNRSVQLSLSGQGARIPSLASTSSVGSAVARARTADGDEEFDNKGNATPRNSGYGGNTLAQVMTQSANYFSRYPIWYGAVTERFTISTDVIESTTISIDPNSGTNSGGTQLNNA